MTHPTCTRCGTAIPDGSPAGECPVCLFQLTLDLSPANDRALDPAAPPPPPEEIQGHFSDLEILEVLGHGGMGVVYKARQTELGRLVAVKVLAPRRKADPEFAERFLREARSLARLNHPHIVSIHDFGSAGGLPYLVMEFVEGASLRARLDAGTLPPEEGLRLIPQVCDAIQYAHDRGVIHRDIKPENVLIDHLGRAKIADFGLAKCDDSGPSLLTEANLRLGTAQYMAPEQWRRSAEVDHRADIYALGVLFYELLTGECPSPHYKPPSVRVGTDPRVDEVIARTLQSDPSRRYQRAAEIKSDLERIDRTSRRAGPVKVALALGLTAVTAGLAWWGLRDHPTSAARPRATAPAAPATPAPPVPLVWSAPENLGPDVNSGDDDGGPGVSADGLTLLFHSRRPGGLGETDIWECRRRSAGEPFGPATNPGAPLNSSDHDGEPTLSPDGLTVVFVSHRPGGLGQSDLWMARRPSPDAPWGEPVALGPGVNTEGLEQRPSLLADGLTLIYYRAGDPSGLHVSRRPAPDAPFGPAARLEPAGAIDQTRLGSAAPDGRTLVYDSGRPGDHLWAARRPATDAPFQEYQSLGPAVNSPAVDTSPALSADGLTLYFCSTRPGGHGNYDLWQSRRVPQPPPTGR